MAEILKTILNEVKPSAEEESRIKEDVSKFINSLEYSLKKLKINARVMTGGSFAKGTTIKKDRYDVDVFVVFDKKYESDRISGMLEKALKAVKIKFDKLPGSRDYFSIERRKFKIEAVPVIGIKKPNEAKNITDLSLLHVNYIRKKIGKNKKLGDEIRLVKAFCYANNCYGAESHIKGFSGYCLELLTSHYGSFDKLIKAASKWKDKTVIDSAGYYRKKNVMLELNEAKLFSPLILIDPVQSDRNAAAALSKEKFDIFIDLCKKFIKKPSKALFEKKIIDENDIIKNAKRKKAMLIKIIAKSDKIKDDIAGAKLLKLFNLLQEKLKKEGYKTEALWDFKNKEARMWFSIKKLKKVERAGPFIEMKKHVSAFKKKYRKSFVKNKRMYALVEPKSLDDLFSVDKKQLSEMGIDSYIFRKLF